MANEVKIPISVPGAATAAADVKKVADAVGGVAAASKTATKANADQAKSAEEAGKKLLSMGEVTEKGIGVGRMFAEVANGNVLALLNVTSALKVTGAAMKANAIGGALLAVTALANFLQNLKGTSAAAQDTAAKVDDLGAAFDKISKAKAEANVTALTQIRDQAKDASNELLRIIALQGQISGAKNAAELAAIAADPNLTASEKALRTGAIEARTVAETRAREDSKLGGEYAGAQSTRDQTAAAAAKASAEAERVRASIADTQSQRQDAARQLRIAQGEFDKQSAFAVQTPEDAAAYLAAQRKVTAAQQQVDSLTTPEATQFLVEQRKLLDALTEQAKTAEKAAADAAQAFQEVGRRVVGVNPDGSVIAAPEAAITRGLEDQKRATEQRQRVSDAWMIDMEAGRTVPKPIQRSVEGVLAPAPSNYGSSTALTGGGFISFAPDQSGPAALGNARAEAAATAEKIKQVIRESGGVIGDAVITALRERDKAIADQIKATRY